MKSIIPALFLLFPAWGLCAESATIPAASPSATVAGSVAGGSTQMIAGVPAVSSSILHGLFEGPGKTCTKVEWERQLASIRAELKGMEDESGKLNREINLPGKGADQAALEARRNILQRRIFGFRKVECRLKNMKDSFKGSGTVFIQPKRLE